MKAIKFKKIYLIPFFLVIFSLALGGFCFAQRELEVSYPGVEAPTSVTTPLSDYVIYIFNLSLIIAGLIAFGALVYGGIRYLTSAGSPVAVSDAKDQIFSGILGLIILLSAYLILTTINPQLVIVSPNIERLGQGIILENSEGEKVTYAVSVADLTDFQPVGYEVLSPSEVLDVYTYSDVNYRPESSKTKIEGSGTFNSPPKSIELQWKPYGVYLCKDCSVWGECKECAVYQESSASLSEKIDNQVSLIHFKYPAGSSDRYRIVLHEEQNYQGRCMVFNSNDSGEAVEVGGSLNIKGASSIHIFYQSNETPGEGVTFYEVKDYNKECTTASEVCYKECATSGSSCGDDCAPHGWSDWDPLPSFGPGKCWGPYTGEELSSLNAEGNSIEINPEKKYMAAVFEKVNYDGRCEVFTMSDPFLTNNHIGICDAPGWGNELRGCFRSVIVKPIK
jgi:hypothetical protein